MRSKVSTNISPNFLLFFSLKANRLYSRSNKGDAAIKKSKDISKNFLEMKKPGSTFSDIDIKLTTPLELKYSVFLNVADTVSKIGDLSHSEVICYKFLYKFL